MALRRIRIRPHTGPGPDHGIGYVLFAWEEPNLFAAINDRKHVGMQVQFGNRQFDRHVEELTESLMQGYSKEWSDFSSRPGYSPTAWHQSRTGWTEPGRTASPNRISSILSARVPDLTYGFIQLHSPNAPGREDIRQDSPDDRKKAGRKETKIETPSGFRSKQWSVAYTLLSKYCFCTSQYNRCDLSKAVSFEFI